MAEERATTPCITTSDKENPSDHQENSDHAHEEPTHYQVIPKHAQDDSAHGHESPGSGQDKSEHNPEDLDYSHKKPEHHRGSPRHDHDDSNKGHSDSNSDHDGSKSDQTKSKYVREDPHDGHEDPNQNHESSEHSPEKPKPKGGDLGYDQEGTQQAGTDEKRHQEGFPHSPSPRKRSIRRSVSDLRIDTNVPNTFKTYFAPILEPPRVNPPVLTLSQYAESLAKSHEERAYKILQEAESSKNALDGKAADIMQEAESSKQVLQAKVQEIIKEAESSKRVLRAKVQEVIKEAESSKRAPKTTAHSVPQEAGQKRVLNELLSETEEDNGENVNVWIGKLPFDCTYSDLLTKLEGTGKIFASSIKSRGAPHWYSSAQVTFWDRGGVAALYAKARAGGLQFGELYQPMLAPSRYRFKAPIPTRKSRVIIITGPKLVVNFETITAYLGARINFYHLEKCDSRIDWDTGLESMRWCFASFAHQADYAHEHLSQAQKEASDRYYRGEAQPEDWAWANITLSWG
ncbi:hypothetical protein F5X98DRAFT_335837 [Xylaria grammica]|nr:hypothetical protein F5X98DRAFT_335837 [Xylaria grammica]